MTLPARADVVVIGGGIVGLALAFELTRRGRRTVVLERDRAGGGCTSAAAGMLAPVSEADVAPQAVIDLAQDSLERYPAFVAAVEQASGVRTGFRTEGTLWVALGRDDLGELERLEQAIAARRLTARRVTAAEVRALEPRLSPRIAGGLLAPDDLQVDPRALARALVVAIGRAGGVVAEGHTARAVDGAGERVRAVAGMAGTGPFAIATPAVVLASGAWAASGVELPIPVPAVRPVRGQLVRLRGPRLIEHVVRSPEVYLVPRDDGELLVGATMEEMGFDSAASAGGVMDLLRRGWEVVPALYDLAFETVSVGLRPALPDGRPAIGPTAVEGLYLALGHFRNGVLLAPATAHHLAEAIVTRRIAGVLAPFTDGG